MCLICLFFLPTGLMAQKQKADSITNLLAVEKTDTGRVKLMWELASVINVYDPQAIKNAQKIFTDIVYCSNPKEAARNADALIILTEWNEFKQLDLDDLKKVMRHYYLFDGRNIYDPKKVKKLGFIYKGVGRE